MRTLFAIIIPYVGRVSAEAIFWIPHTNSKTPNTKPACATLKYPCVKIEASYHYNDDDESTIEVSSSVGCGNRGPFEGSCSVTVNGQTCSSCRAGRGFLTSEHVVTLLDDCGDILLWRLSPNTTTILLGAFGSRAIGYFPLKQNHVTDCQYDGAVLPPTPSPSCGEGDGGTTSSSPTTSTIVFDKPQCYEDIDIPGCYEIDVDTGNILTSDCGTNSSSTCYNVDISMSAKTYSSGCQELQATYNYGQSNPTVIITSFQSCGSSDDGGSDNDYCEVQIDDLICNDCTIELDTTNNNTIGDYSSSFQFQKVIVGESCGNRDAGGVLGGYLPPREQTIPYFNAGVGYLELDDDVAVCLSDTVLPTGIPTTSSAPTGSPAPSESPSTSPRPTVSTPGPSESPSTPGPTGFTRKFNSPVGGDSVKSKAKGGGDNAIVLKTTFELTLTNQQEEEGSPTPNERKALWDRTQNFIDEVMTNHYGSNGYLGSEMIAPKDSQPSPNQFQLSFTLKIHLDESSSSVLGSMNGQRKRTAQLLSNSINLQPFVGVFIRYIDDNQTIENGYFYNTQKVFAKIVGGQGVNESNGRRLRYLSYSGSSTATSH